MNGKQQTMLFLSKDGSLHEGTIFMPRSMGYGANLIRVTPEELRNDAGLFLKSLQKEAELLHPDVIVLNYDPTYLAEMSGCHVQMTSPYVWQIVSHSLDGREAEWADFSITNLADSGRLSLYRDVLTMMKKLSQTPVFSLVPTPLTLCRQLTGDSFLQKLAEKDSQWEELMDAALYVISDTLKVYLEGGSEGILFYEDLSGFETAQLNLPSNLIDFYRTLYNILKHYQKRAIFWMCGTPPEGANVYRHETVIGTIAGIDSCIDFKETDEQLAQKIASDLNQVKRSQSFVYSPLILPQAQPEKVLALVQQVHSRKNEQVGSELVAAANS